MKFYPLAQRTRWVRLTKKPEVENRVTLSPTISGIPLKTHFFLLLLLRVHLFVAESLPVCEK